MRERLYQVILGPHISEKSANVADQHNQVVFKVALDANKIEIKQAVESLFKVTVENVSVARQEGKQKMHGNIKGRRNRTKKAYVKLKKGQEIQFTEQV